MLELLIIIYIISSIIFLLLSYFAHLTNQLSYNILIVLTIVGLIPFINTFIIFMVIYCLITKTSVWDYDTNPNDEIEQLGEEIRKKFKL